MVKITLTLLEV